MTPLTRRRSDNEHQESWHIYSGDVRVGFIRMRAGVPISADQWSWAVGFYPGLDPGQHCSGSAASFDDARAAFERAWPQLEPRLSEAQFELWRRDRDFHAWKQRMQAAGLRIPTQIANDQSTCFCGTPITFAIEVHIYTAHRGIGA